MLRNSFIFLPQIGKVRERRLWEDGVTDWRDYRDVDDPPGVGDETQARHVELLEEAEQACRTGTWHMIGRMFPDDEHWRVFDDLGDDAVYLDIETTGTGRTSEITVVGMKGPFGTDALVRGQDLTREAVRDRLKQASMLVTFYGSSFDIPFLQRAGYHVPDVPHLDLCFSLRRVGYSGGLKSIEGEFGLERDDDLQGLDGYDAVRMWRQWKRDRDREALDRLVRYNVADIDNLEILAETCYSELRKQTVGPLEEALA